MTFRPIRAGLSRRRLLTGVAAATVAPASSIAAPTSGNRAVNRPSSGLQFAGVNIAGGEFGRVSGRRGHDYAYPDRSELARWAAFGFNLVRVPFLWERVQPTPMGDLEPGDLGALRNVVQTSRGLGLSVVLDVHNYARRRLADERWRHEHLLGSSRLPAEAFRDLWRRLAAEFKSQPHVMLGLMNEPHGLPPAMWFECAQAAVTAIRAEGARQRVLIPGVAFTGAHSWQRAGNAIMGGIEDPEGNLAIEVHQYFDADNSGTTATAVSPTIGTDRIADFTEWARRRGLRAFLGEFGGADNPVALAALDDICATMRKDGDVWLGWAAWAAGSWWRPDYHFRLNPGPDGALPPPTRVLARHAALLTGARDAP